MKKMLFKAKSKIIEKISKLQMFSSQISEEKKDITLTTGIMFLMMACRMAYAAATTESIVNVIIRALTVIMSFLGFIFVVVGIIKILIAHANGEGPSANNAGQFIAAGAGLLVTVGLLRGLESTFVSWIDG